MTTLSTPRTTLAQSALDLHRFSVAQYQRMIEMGILNGQDRVELLEGWIVDKMPHNPPHDATVTRLQRRLSRILGEEWLIRVQCALTLADSQPEPDLAIVAGPEETYFSRHPTARETALLIEVADTTLEQDRQFKARLYARARIPMYWITNLSAAAIEVHTRPRAGRSPAYRQRQVFGIEEAVPLVLAGHDLGAIPVRDLLPAGAS